ncbi:MAG: YceI family protein [Caldilineaceae bacterium]|jgi:polyisoprenoid-binding protein YceI
MRGTHPVRSLLAILLVVMLVVVLAACGSGGSTTPTQTAAEAPTEAPAEATAQPAEEPATEEPAAETAVETETGEATEEPAAETEVVTDTMTEAGDASAEPAAGLQTFTIVPDGSEARFSIGEVLFGQDNTVIGVTSDVSGEIQLDSANPAASELGPITINASDLTTDNDRRNGAIRRFILQSDQDQYQYITFTPTGIEGMPDTVTVGEPFDFQVTGDLQIRDVVNTETFDVTVTPVSDTEITGLATTTIQRGDYNLTIPQVPSVTAVDEEVILEFEFTAEAQ